jgi:hypothetical protein
MVKIHTEKRPLYAFHIVKSYQIMVAIPISMGEITMCTKFCSENSERGGMKYSMGV